MKSRIITGWFFAVAAGIMLGISTVMPGKAAALTPVGTDPVQISPVCSTEAENSATWSAYNKNAYDVTFNWENKDTGATGSYTAPADSTTDFNTNYRAGVNNQTVFTDEGSTSPVSRNASNTECTQPEEECIDGNIASNLITTWDGNGTFTVQTKGNALLCEDVTVYASSYILPDNYDGSGFGGPTSYPQYLYDSKSTVLKAGTDGKTTMSVNLPESCRNNQQDLYYAPEIKIVSQNGHGDQFLAGGIKAKTTDICNGGGHGGGPSAPETPVTPTEPAPVQPAQSTGGKGAGTPAVAAATPTTTLADTGTDSRPASIIAAVLLATAVLVATRRSKVSG